MGCNQFQTVKLLHISWKLPSSICHAFNYITHTPKNGTKKDVNKNSIVDFKPLEKTCFSIQN